MERDTGLTRFTCFLCQTRIYEIQKVIKKTFIRRVSFHFCQKTSVNQIGFFCVIKNQSPPPFVTTHKFWEESRFVKIIGWNQGRSKYSSHAISLLLRVCFHAHLCFNVFGNKVYFLQEAIYWHVVNIWIISVTDWSSVNNWWLIRGYLKFCLWVGQWDFNLKL